jgi:hypothetical protein
MGENQDSAYRQAFLTKKFVMTGWYQTGITDARATSFFTCKQ